MSSTEFVEIRDNASLDHFLKSSPEAPVILFKHSNSCGVSAQAYREMAKLGRTVGLITVQKARILSDEVERRFGLSHETPQVMLVRDNEVFWNASHGRVRADAVEKALSAADSAELQ